MDYLTVRETAEKWNLSIRMVQQFCTQGRIPGAQKFGKAWAIPADAAKPQDPRFAPKQETAVPADLLDHTNLMPLMNTTFHPGRCLATVEAMKEGLQRNIAQAEYYYFTGKPGGGGQGSGALPHQPRHGGAAVRLPALRLRQPLHPPDSACALRTQRSAEISGFQCGDRAPSACGGTFVAAVSAVLLHLPLSRFLPSAKEFLPLLPPGLRAFALYVQAHYLYPPKKLRPEYRHRRDCPGHGRGAVPHPRHLSASDSGHGLHQPEKAGTGPGASSGGLGVGPADDLIEGFGEHHGLLGGMLESVIKPGWPEEFKRIIAITYRFSWGWRRIHNPDTGHEVAGQSHYYGICGGNADRTRLDQRGDRRPHGRVGIHHQAPSGADSGKITGEKPARAGQASAGVTCASLCAFAHREAPAFSGAFFIKVFSRKAEKGSNTSLFLQKIM